MVVNPSGDTGEAMARALEDGGDRVVQIRDAAHIDAALVEATRDRDVRGVLLCDGAVGSATSGGELTADDVMSATLRALDDVLSIVGGLSRREWHVWPRVWLLTRGAMPEAVDPAGAVQGALWGFGRVLAEEHRESWGGLINLDPQEPRDAAATRVAVDVRAATRDNQTAYRNGRRLVPRLMDWEPEAPARSGRFHADGVYLVTGGLGALGLAVAQWAAAEGARHLVLLGRTGLGSETDPPNAEKVRAIARMRPWRVA